MTSQTVATGRARLALERRVRVVFVVNALINWLISVRGVLDPAGMAQTFRFDDPPAQYTFVVRLWACFVFMFGCMFFEVSRDVSGKAALVKYNWIEKTITAGVVTLGFIQGHAPERLMGLIVLTNWLWIPPLLYFDVKLREELGRSRR